MQQSSIVTAVKTSMLASALSYYLIKFRLTKKKQTPNSFLVKEHLICIKLAIFHPWTCKAVLGGNVCTHVWIYVEDFVPTWRVVYPFRVRWKWRPCQQLWLVASALCLLRTLELLQEEAFGSLVTMDSGEAVQMQHVEPKSQSHSVFSPLWLV